MSAKFTMTGAYSKEIERKLMEVADLIAATLDQPADMRAWDNLLIYCPREALDRRMMTLNPGADL